MVWEKFLDNLPLARKFLIFAILAALLVAAPLVVHLRDSNDAIAITQRARDGIQPAQQLLRVLQFVQQHRGLSAMVLGGNAAMEQRRITAQTAANGAIDTFSQMFKSRFSNHAIEQSWHTTEAEWKSLGQAVSARTVDAQPSFTRHSALVAQLLNVLELMADHYGLRLDPQPDGSYLEAAALRHLPQLTETLGLMRTQGSLYLSKRDEMSASERAEIITLMALGRVHRHAWVNAIDKATATNAMLQVRLAAIAAECQKRYEEVVKLVREQLIDMTDPLYSSAAYFRVYTVAIDEHFRLNSATFESLDELLTARVAALRLKQHTVLVAVLLAAVLAVGVGYAVMRSISHPLAQAAGMAARFTSGDLTPRQGMAMKNEIGHLFDTLDTMRAGLAASVSEIRLVADSVGTASEEIARGNNDLSTRTEQQAVSLEQTALSMDEFTATVKQNSGSAIQASVLAKEASAIAMQGGAAVRSVVSTMQGISESSRRIADIITVIDSIAFQTNILALNAAVEAARAGDEGRGFAVVALEVRSLAQRSAQAAKEIKGLIQESVARVSGGVRQVEDAGKTMDEIVASVNTVSDLFAEIAGASAEQLTGIEKVNHAITQMEGNTQRNATVVQQAAAAAAHMANQAQVLVASVAKFKLMEEQNTRRHNAVPPAASRSSAEATLARVPSASRANLVTSDDSATMKGRALPPGTGSGSS